MSPTDDGVIPRLDANASPQEKLRYWLSRPPEERMAEADRLRGEAMAGPQRIQRAVRVIDLSRYRARRHLR